MQQLEFYGAAGQVTGSCHILRTEGQTVLLDCGMIQGGSDDELGNDAEFPFDPAAVDAVILSHAHLDHSGRLPLLVKRGFRGVIHAQKATGALLRILLSDAANIEMSNVRRDNRRRSDRGQALRQPLFDGQDVVRALELTQGHRYHRDFDVVPGMRACFHDAGHILGAAVVELRLTHGGRETTLVFSGDLGQADSPILRTPEAPAQADLVIMETTYGDRRHRNLEDSLEEFGQVLQRAHDAGGNVLIPAFAVGRSQELLYFLGKYYDEWQVGRWEIFLDSPLAIEASEIYWDFPHLFDEEASDSFREEDFMPSLPNLHFTRTGAESRVINRMKRGAIVIAGSGMCNGGRILHHFRRDIGRPETLIVFTGFQPRGTLGRRIIDGADSVCIYGDEYPVRAAVHTIGGFSAHGDQEDLLNWYDRFPATANGQWPPVFLVHGDPEAMVAFRDALRTRSGVTAQIAGVGEQVDLSTLAGPKNGAGRGD